MDWLPITTCWPDNAINNEKEHKYEPARSCRHGRGNRGGKWYEQLLVPGTVHATCNYVSGRLLLSTVMWGSRQIYHLSDQVCRFSRDLLIISVGGFDSVYSKHLWWSRKYLERQELTSIRGPVLSLSASIARLLSRVRIFLDVWDNTIKLKWNKNYILDWGCCFDDVPLPKHGSL